MGALHTRLATTLADTLTATPVDTLVLGSRQAGAMQVRELSGTVVLGQELPMHRVPAPTAREVK